MSLARRLLVPLLILLIALMSWLSPVAQAPAAPITANPSASVGEGWLESRQGFRVLHLGGSPYEMGYQHGVLLRDAIRARLGDGLWGGIVQDGQVSPFLLLRHAHQTESGIPSEYREEMAGVAAGAGVSYSDVLVLNTCRDLVARPWPGESLHNLLLTLSPPFVPPAVLPGALIEPGQEARFAPSSVVSRGELQGAIAVFGAATEDGQLLQAAGFAPPAPHPQQLAAIIYQPQEGCSYVCVVAPGTVGCEVGLNEEQIAVTALPSPSRDSSLEAVPLAFVLRDVLQDAGDIPRALTILASGGRTTGHNVLLGDGKRPDAQAMELSTRLHAVFEAHNDFVVRTNHFLDHDLAETQSSVSWWQEDESWAHLEQLLKALESDYGRLDAAGATRLVREVAFNAETVSSGANEPEVLGVVLAPGDLEISLVVSSSEGESLVVSLEGRP